MTQTATPPQTFVETARALAGQVVLVDFQGAMYERSMAVGGSGQAVGVLSNVDVNRYAWVGCCKIDLTRDVRDICAL